MPAEGSEQEARSLRMPPPRERQAAAAPSRPRREAPISRRLFLASALTTTGALLTGCRQPLQRAATLAPLPATPSLARPPDSRPPSRPRPSRILLENQKPGAADWYPARTSEALPLGLYASASSIAAGEQLRLCASARRATTCRLEVFRLGYYGGAGARRVLLRDTVAVPAQGWWTAAAGLQDARAASVDAATGLLDCRWEPVATVTPASDWLSGCYVARLTDSGGAQCATGFVLRDDERPGALLVQSPVFTHQAYNGWGGKSLYSYTSTNPALIFGKRKAVKVSFNRPYRQSDGFAEFLNYEPDFVRWVEWLGYDVSYWTDADLHQRPELLRSARALLCIGHDEYWTAQMLDHALAAREAGVHLAFLGGNDVYWQIRLEPDTVGSQQRTVVCYKQAETDPRRAEPRAVTVRFVDPPVNRPQSILTGAVYGSELWPFTQPWVVAREHWLLAGTGLQRGDRIPNLVGREYDRLAPNPGMPATVEVIAASPVRDAHGGQGVASTILAPAPSGALVFSAGTLYWTRGLVNRSPTFDPRVGQITANLLNRFLAP